jgi:hypothetical protein
LINKYKHDSQFRYNVLKRLDELSKTRKLYQSISFLKFLRKISKNEDKNELVMFLYILHNLILISKEYDKQTYSSLVAVFYSINLYMVIIYPCLGFYRMMDYHIRIFIYLHIQIFVGQFEVHILSGID